MITLSSSSFQLFTVTKSHAEHYSAIFTSPFALGYQQSDHGNIYVLKGPWHLRSQHLKLLVQLNTFTEVHLEIVSIILLFSTDTKISKSKLLTLAESLHHSLTA